MKLVCLTPFRNAVNHLPGYFASVAGFCDGIVALDDGSTDDTAERLQDHPLTLRLLRNPQRPSYAGWDDAENRSRLLDAAGEFEPDWIVQLDADEQMDVEAGAALRDFLEAEGCREFAYGFEVCRMIGDACHFDRTLAVYRLFAYRAGLRFPRKKLHFVPIPTAITRERWFLLRLRLKHFASLTADLRRQRFDKYRVADPGNEWQKSYDNLLVEPRDLKPWEGGRPAGLLVEPQRHSAFKQRFGGLLPARAAPKVLSVVVIAQNDADTIARSLQAIFSEALPFPFEVIVVCSGTDRTAAIVREEFPQAKLLEIPPALPGAARNAGLRAATGEYVSFPGSHVIVCAGSLKARVDAHELGYCMVTGPIANGNPTRAGWVSYYLDHSGSLPGVLSMELQAAPHHCSYWRNALEFVNGFPEHLRAGEDTAVNAALFGLGFSAYREGKAQLIHHSLCTSVPRLCGHHFSRGKAYGILLVSEAAGNPAQSDRLTRHCVRRVGEFLFVYPAKRFRRIRRDLQSAPAEHIARLYRLSPIVILAILAAAGGGIAGVIASYCRPQLRTPRGHTQNK
jgi:glycosyltransferase involved in cell wall biosynthesis